MNNQLYRMPYTVGPVKRLCEMTDQELAAEAYAAETSVTAAEENEAVGWGYDPAPRDRLEAAKREQRFRRIEKQVDRWGVAPEDSGQIVEVSYRGSADGTLIYKRVFDHSDSTRTIYVTDWPDGLLVEPVNGADNLRRLEWKEA